MMATQTMLSGNSKLEIKFSCKRVGFDPRNVVAQSSGDVEAPRGKKVKMVGKVTSQSPTIQTGFGANAAAKTVNNSSVVIASKKRSVSLLDEETVCPSSVPNAASISSVPFSPKKALHVAMLKSRFADTFLKAEQKYLDRGNMSDPLKMQQEKAKLERKYRLGKAKIDAELRAAEAAVQRQAEVELKRLQERERAVRGQAELELKEQREKERGEARVALEKMERTFLFEDNCYILEELKKLAGYRGGSWGWHFQSPLEQLGLFIKDEYELEEGEIFLRERDH
ncbi:transcription factor GTE9-like [Argentina anserina]|uniref:transcription factor GTE9-like n=1 Tax=Argentina anserina TaxID=57926 RepID=UPI0021764E45|nr:transcription factor GTE9-like [Potentilla anserina]XP_050386126.1 transcription factor GTE9-like [Potentilla anserina]XP_050386127.1 transcription factor GTE9-like [Potentilla anserina]XP_050386128.1 transcription factor GTE9-like [Potentilla anserina]XP_050386129.1 transcription factor GTE9-like [Potentilla anserina]